jgi:ISXO2-like transposase domain
LIAIAAQEDGAGIGRIRMQRIPDASAASLMPFLTEAVEPGSTIHTDGWLGYLPAESKGYVHRVTFLKGKKGVGIRTDAPRPSNRISVEALDPGHTPRGD